MLGTDIHGLLCSEAAVYSELPLVKSLIFGFSWKYLSKLSCGMERSFLYIDMLKGLRQNILRAVSRMNNTADSRGLANKLFQTYIAPIIEHYNPIISPLASHYGSTLYRARKCTADTEYTSIKDLLNPPSPSGRAVSSDAQSILYASSSLQSCKAELDLKIGDLVNIVGLDYTEISSQPFWFIGQLAAFHKSKEPSHYVSERNGLDVTAYFSHDAQQSFIYQDALINEIFSTISSPTDGYSLNRYLIEAIYKKLPKDPALAGVVYLSVKDAPGINFAIFGDAISKLKIGQLNSIRVTDIDDYGTVGYRLLKNGSLKDQQIIWRDV